MMRLPQSMNPGMPAQEPLQPMPFHGGLGGFRPKGPMMPPSMPGIGQVPSLPPQATGGQMPGQFPPGQFPGQGMPAMPPQIPPQVLAMLQQRFGPGATGVANPMPGMPQPGGGMPAIPPAAQGRGLFAGNPFQQGQGAGQMLGRTRSRGVPPQGGSLY